MGFPFCQGNMQINRAALICIEIRYAVIYGHSNIFLPLPPHSLTFFKGTLVMFPWREATEQNLIFISCAFLLCFLLLILISLAFFTPSQLIWKQMFREQRNLTLFLSSREMRKAHLTKGVLFVLYRAHNSSFVML